MKLKCVNLQKDLCALHEEVKVAKFWKEVVTIHGSPSPLAACMTDIKDALKDAQEWHKVVSTSVQEKDRHVEKYQKDTQALKSLQDEVADMRRELHDNLEQTMWDVLGVRE